jgi:hypothetical protein
MNLQEGICVDAQKAFIEKTNGSSERGILSNELFQDPKRKDKDLVVTAIDFSNVFDSISHDLIMLTLKQLTFLDQVASTCMITQNQQSKTGEDKRVQSNGGKELNKDAAQIRSYSTLAWSLYLKQSREIRPYNEHTCKRKKNYLST